MGLNLCATRSVIKILGNFHNQIISTSVVCANTKSPSNLSNKKGAVFLNEKEQI